jgi:hypothetical protein
MTSALALNAQATIINGHGLAQSSTVSNEIVQYANLPTVKLIANIFSQVSNFAGGMLIDSVANIGARVDSTAFLIDFYPSGTSATSSADVSYYGTIPTGVYVDDGQGGQRQTGWANVAVPGTASFSGTLLAQANLPFAHGYSGFANVLLKTYSAAAQSFETTSSINILQTKTYAASGIGFKGPLQLATGGIGSNGPVLSDLVSGFGTLYDVTNFTQLGNVYVFGQNLLSQRMGKYGLDDLFTAAGLNLGDISKPPTSTTVSYTQSSTSTVTGFVGQVNLPSQETVTVTTPVTASSPATMNNIYKQIIGANLTSIITGTTFTKPVSATVTSLNDYLNLSKIVDPAIYKKLVGIGIIDFESLGNFLHKTLGQASFNSWDSMATFFSSIEVPKLSTTNQPGGSSLILSPSTISTLQTNTVTGTGALGQALMSDFLGACAGIPYSVGLQTIINNYPLIPTAQLVSALTTLSNSIATYIATPPVGDPPVYAQPTAVVNAVNLVNSVLTSYVTSAPLLTASNAYKAMVNNLNIEVTNLARANVVFNAGQSSLLSSLASQIISIGTDKTRTQSYQFVANIISNDSYGDTIKSAIAESINQSILQSAGITVSNDPNPSMILQQSAAQKVPITTYLSQNK